MATVIGLPGLSKLLAWPTEHLTEAADYWLDKGGRCYEVANQVWRDASSIDWQGDAADALRIATHADMMTTSAVADRLDEAAKIARKGHPTFTPLALEWRTRSTTLALRGST